MSVLVKYFSGRVNFITIGVMGTLYPIEKILSKIIFDLINSLVTSMNGQILVRIFSQIQSRITINRYTTPDEIIYKYMSF